MDSSQFDLACRTAENFLKLYYDSLDRKRHLMTKLYLDTATLVWNGNGSTGKEGIQNFLSELPSGSHAYNCFDIQQIPDCAVGENLTYVIQTSGTVKYPGTSSLKHFMQNFVITAEGDKWKIVSDCFRFQEPIPS
uniref:NTF2-related export protein n=1 Tax=Clastoptera arizonana TaxID=38151 RepID=A0A1B6CKC7_9HEMI